jgi:hypothetical protein
MRVYRRTLHHSLHRRKGRSRPLLIVAVLVSSLVVASPAVTHAYASGIPTCSTSQVEVAVANDSGAYAAAGNHGLPFIIINTSKTTCTLMGYPRISFSPDRYKGRTVKTVDGGAMIFVPVKARVVVLRPGYTASFGVDYGDAYDQQDPSSGPCETHGATVLLPVRPHPYSVPFNVALEFNFCYAGFSVTVTSIQSGPIPKEA